MRDADVVIATWWETAEWIAQWPQSHGLKTYFIRHYEVWGGDPEKVNATYQMPFKKLVIAKWLKKLMADAFGDNTAVLVPNGVDQAQFNAPERSKSNTPTIGMMYGEASWKGADAAFEAIHKVQERLPNARLLAFGSVAPESQSSTLPANMTFFERPPQDQIAEIYRQADCWLVPSTSEGFGMPGIEAAACRCPLVSTRCGGPEDYVQDGINGFLVPVGDSAAMASRIMDVLSLPADRWKQMSNASFRISQKFNWDESAAVLEDTLLTDLQNRKQPATLP